VNHRSHLYPWIEERSREAAEGIAQLIAGHSETKTTIGYAHEPSMEELKKAM